jgi:hypothetical protein
MDYYATFSYFVHQFVAHGRECVCRPKVRNYTNVSLAMHVKLGLRGSESSWHFPTLHFSYSL